MNPLHMEMLVKLCAVCSKLAESDHNIRLVRDVIYGIVVDNPENEEQYEDMQEARAALADLSKIVEIRIAKQQIKNEKPN